MSQVMEGVRILETFVRHVGDPRRVGYGGHRGSEHMRRGDSMRGLVTGGLAGHGRGWHVLLSTRGKQSLAVDLATPEGVEIIYQLAERPRTCLHNKLPKVQKLHIDFDDIRAHNQDIIYVSGTVSGRAPRRQGPRRLQHAGVLEPLGASVAATTWRTSTSCRCRLPPTATAVGV